MAGEDQYIHPIIQAMAQMQQGLIAKQQLAQQQQNLQSEQEARQKQSDLAVKALQEEHDFHAGQLKLAQTKQQAEQEMQLMQGRKDIADILKSGIDPSAFVNQGQAAPQAQVQGLPNGMPQVPDTRAISLPGGNSLPLSQLPNFQQYMQGQAQAQGELAQAKAGGEAAGQEPYEIAQEARRAATAKQLKQMDIDAEAAKFKNNAVLQKQLEQMRTGPEYQRNQLEYGTTPAQEDAGVTGFLTGDFTPANTDLTNPRASRYYTAASNLGFKALSKDDNQFYDNANRVDDAVKALRNVASQLPDESKLGSTGAVVNARAQSALTNSSLSTDLKNQMNELNLRIPAIMRSVQQYPGSRMNTNDMLMIQHGLTNVGTMQQAQDYANNLLHMRDQNVISSQGGMPKVQQDALWTRKNIVPSYVIQSRNPQMEQQGYTLDMNGSMKAGKAIYDSPTGVQSGQ